MLYLPNGESGSQILLARCIICTAPDLILVPYQFDPHRDHRVSWQMLQNSVPDSLIFLSGIPALVISLGKTDDPKPLKQRYIIYVTWTSMSRWLKRKRPAQHLSQLNTDVFENPKGSCSGSTTTSSISGFLYSPLFKLKSAFYIL